MGVKSLICLPEGAPISKVEATKRLGAEFTTFEPDDSMIECAIRALELVIPEEKGKDQW